MRNMSKLVKSVHDITRHLSAGLLKPLSVAYCSWSLISVDFISNLHALMGFTNLWVHLPANLSFYWSCPWQVISSVKITLQNSRTLFIWYRSPVYITCTKSIQSATQYQHHLSSGQFEWLSQEKISCFLRCYCIHNQQDWSCYLSWWNIPWLSSWTEE